MVGAANCTAVTPPHTFDCTEYGTPGDDTSDDGLSGAGLAGIAVGAVVVSAGLLYGIIRYRRQSRPAFNAFTDEEES